MSGDGAVIEGEGKTLGCVHREEREGKERKEKKKENTQVVTS